MALARYLSLQMQICYSRSTIVDPELSNALSLDACRSKCTYVTIARCLSIQMKTNTWKYLFCRAKTTGRACRSRHYVCSVWRLASAQTPHGVRGIRVFRPGLDFAKCEFGGFEIWVLQKYAQRSKNTSFSSAPRCGWRRPVGGQNIVISGTRAALEEYVGFLRI